MDVGNTWQTVKVALVWLLLAALAFLAWWIRQAVLLAFGSIIAALLLRMIARGVARWTAISEQVGLVIATGLVLAVIGVTLWLFGSQIESQFSELIKHIEAGEHYLNSVLEKGALGSLGATVTEHGSSLITGMLGDVLSRGLRFAEGAVVVAIGAVYLAARPDLYIHGFAMLFPSRQQLRVVRSINLVGHALRLWLMGQFILMLMVGILSFIAAWVIGLPNPGALGLIAGIAEIVPYLGPFIGAIPAVLVGLAQGVASALWIAGAYLVIHIFEGYITAPLIERYFVTIPPALVLIGIVIVDLLFGTVGVIFAAPITVAAFMAVKMIYVDDPLEENMKDQKRHAA